MNNKIVIVGKTKKGKEIGWRDTGKNCFKEAAFATGGQVPESLKGVYSNIKLLESNILTYLALEKSKKQEADK